MDCSKALEGFSDYLDGLLAGETLEAFESHLRSCSSCRRYGKVLETGAELLRQLPAPELRDDFQARLRHRIYNLDEQRALLASSSGSATRAGTALAIALLLAAAAWSAALGDPIPQVSLPAIVVSEDQVVRPLPSLLRPSTVASGLMPEPRLRWRTPVLYEYSPLYERYPPTRFFRVGLD